MKKETFYQVQSHFTCFKLYPVKEYLPFRVCLLKDLQNLSCLGAIFVTVGNEDVVFDSVLCPPGRCGGAWLIFALFQ